MSEDDAGKIRSGSVGAVSFRGRSGERSDRSVHRVELVQPVWHFSAGMAVFPYVFKKHPETV